MLLFWRAKRQFKQYKCHILAFLRRRLQCQIMAYNFYEMDPWLLDCCTYLTVLFIAANTTTTWNISTLTRRKMAAFVLTSTKSLVTQSVDSLKKIKINIFEDFEENYNYN